MLNGCECEYCLLSFFKENNVHDEEVQGQQEDEHVHDQEVGVSVYQTHT